jgi:hypothetical protein
MSAIQSMPAVILAAVPLLAAALLTGCDIVGLGTQKFVIPVDSIQAPATAGAGDVITVVFHGWIGANGCSSLSRVARNATSGSLTITFHGEHRRGDCHQSLVSLLHTERIDPPHIDPLTIRVVQPRGARLEAVIRVQ